MDLSYHYTTIEKFQNLLESSVGANGKITEFNFWASSIYAMNDPKEFLFGYDKLWDDLIPLIEKEIGINDDKHKLSMLWEKYKFSSKNEWKEAVLKGLYDIHETPFIISFSKNEDRLPMWTTYANNGNGICLGFSNYEYKINNYNTKISDADVEIIHNLHTSEVTYDKPDELVNKMVERYYSDFYNKYSTILDESQLNKKMAEAFAFLSIIAAPYHKHKAYEYEKEERLIVFKKDETDVKYRCNILGRLIPYIIVPIKAKYLKRIIIGPCADFTSLRRELYLELSKLGVKIDIEAITQSDVPYRIF